MSAYFVIQTIQQWNLRKLELPFFSQQKLLLKELWTFSENVNRFVSLAPLGTVLLGLSLGIDEALNGEINAHCFDQISINPNDGVLPHLDSSGLSIHCGKFTGNADQLNQLAQAGLVEGTEHINSDEIERSYAARESFFKHAWLWWTTPRFWGSSHCSLIRRQGRYSEQYDIAFWNWSWSYYSNAIRILSVVERL